MNIMPDPSQLPLRDIHLPEAVSCWPLAPGWWIIIGLVILIIAVTIVLYRRRKRYLSSPAYQSGLELEKLKQAYAINSDDLQLIRTLSSLIRRVAISVYPRIDAASLSGERWLAFLDQVMPDQPFSKGPGQVLASGPYQTDVNIDANRMIELTKAWIDKAIQHSSDR